MKKIAITLSIIALLLLGVIIYGVVHTRLDIKLVAPTSTPAKELANEFERWTNAHAIGAVQGVVYDETPIGSIEDYYFNVYGAEIKNNGLIPARMCEMQISPHKGDVLSYSSKVSLGKDDNTEISIKPGESATLQLIMLTKSQENEVREITVSYYIWGKPFFIKDTVRR
ncbi:MAG: hypothetical protein ACOX54_09505 [Christensenellales bacterium]|jgi:hypothetical protein|nr:hypothetical protein [Christensenellaceae bacterium]